MTAPQATLRTDARAEPRDEVFHRACARAEGCAPFNLLVVNVSPSGLMARCEEDIAPDSPLSILLPVAGRLRASVVWALGGRIGCRFGETIPPALYYEMLAALRR